MFEAPQSLAGVEFDHALARVSFRHFLRYVKIKSDDPLVPGVIDFKPFGFQWDMADLFASGEDVIWLKRRQIGASKGLLAPYALWVAMYHPSSDVGVVSINERDAQEFLGNARSIYENLPEGLRPVRERLGVEKMVFGPVSEESELISFPSTVNAGVGYTFRLFVMDEAARHPHGLINYQNVLPAVGHAQIVLASTANPELGQTGFFYDKWVEVGAGLSKLVPVFTGRYARPDEGDDYFERQRVELGERVFAAYYPLTPGEAFQSVEGLVYGDDFDAGRNVGAPERPLEACERVYVSYDLGGGDPTAFNLFGAWKDQKRGGYHVHCYGEWHKQTGLISVEDGIGVVARWERRFGVRVDAIIPDHADLNFAETWKKIPDRRLWHAEGKGRTRWLRQKGKGLSLQAQFLREGRYTISPECEYTISEYATYRWHERPDEHTKERFGTATPSDHHGDHKDCFVAGTMVATPDGEVPIEGLQVGDRVLTREGPREVVKAHPAHEAAVWTVRLSNGRELTGTGDHPVWLGDRFVPLNALRYGDIPQAATAGSEPAPVVVLELRAEPQPRQVYNLTVAETPEFFANGVLVHNCERYALLAIWHDLLRPRRPWTMERGLR